MKRLASILLLGILAFNWFGYRIFAAYAEQKANDRLEAELDQDHYEEAALLLVKVPAVHLSYYNSSSSFERATGQVEINGIEYKFVKRRLYNDSVELLCIPNQNSLKIQSAKDEFFKLVNDLQQNGTGKKSGPRPAFPKNFSMDYCSIEDHFRLDDLYSVQSKKNNSFAARIPSPYPLAVERPPDISA